MRIDSPTLEKFRRLVVDLNVQWQMFEGLFSEPSNFIAFNRCGANFWVHLHSYLLDLLFLSISRFFDPAVQLRQQNLSLQVVADLPEARPIAGELRRRLDQMKPVWERGIKTWRNKRLSHSDMPTALGSATLPDIPTSDILALVEGISSFAWEIDHRLNQCDVSYKVALNGWVPEILQRLESA